MPIFRFIFLSLAMLLLSVFAGSQQIFALDQGDEYKRFQDCLNIEDKAVRFVCYETFANGKIFSQKKAEIEQKKAFGTGVKTTIDTMSNLTVTIENVTKTVSGSLVFKTSDNQVWKQKDTRYFRKIQVPFDATIKKKVISGYSLSPVGSKASVTVVRVK